MNPPLEPWEDVLRPPPRKTSPRMNRAIWSCLIITIILAALPMLNIAAFIVVATILGGDALNGHAEGGHYFLRAHGRDTEVSQAVFNYSRIHAYTMFGSIALYLLAGLAVLLLKALAFFLPRRNRYRRL